MFKRVLLVLLLSSAACTWAQTAAIQGFCDLGGAQAKTSGLNSINYQQGIVPSCQITVYLTGTTTKATIYADGNNTPLSNPFTASALGSVAPGQWIFFSALNQGVDIVASGGISPNTYPAPVTLCVDCFPSQSISPVAGVTSITDSTSATGAITFNGSGVSQSGNTFTFNGGTCTGCVLTNPTGSQNIVQPEGTSFTLNTKNFCLQDGTNCPTAPTSGVQYNSPTTNYIWYSDSIFIVSTADTVAATAVSCDGTTCTVTAPNSYIAGQPVQFENNTAFSPSCMAWAIAAVEPTGLSSTQFEVSETNWLGLGLVGSAGCSGTQTGTGGSVQDASYFSPFAASKLPFFAGHGTTYDYGEAGGTSTDMVNDYARMVHPHTTAVTGQPSFVIVKFNNNDLDGSIGGNCFPTATIEANYQTLWADAHADGAQVIMLTGEAATSGCTNGYATIATIQDWIRGQGPQSSASGQPAGAHWDRLVDLATVLTNFNDANFRISGQNHLNDAGNAIVAALTNQAMGVQGSVIEALTSCGAVSNTPCLNWTGGGTAQTQIFSFPQEIESDINPVLQLVDQTAPAGTLGFGFQFASGPVWPHIDFNGETSITFEPSTGANKLVLDGDVLAWSANGHFPPPDVGLSRDSAGALDVGNGTYSDKSGSLFLASETLTGSLNLNATVTTITGTTAGTALWSEPQQGTAVKLAMLNLNGYENTTATAQTITLPASFGTVSGVVTDSGVCTGVTISGATVTLPASMGAAQTGLCEIRGW